MKETTSSVPHVEFAKISKHFGGVQALNNINMRVTRGKVHALVGENGAGKSTLSKICGGTTQPDAGQLLIHANPVLLHSPRQALALGIATIAQELALAPNLSVEQNVFLGSEPRSAGFISNRRLKREYQALTESIGFDLPAKAIVGSLRTADQQKVEIMRALSRGASMIIMDEPTAALGRSDTERLHEVIRSLAASGHTILLISHFLSEVLALADEITILRDGKLVRSVPVAEENEASLIEGMLGRNLDSVYPSKPPVPQNPEPVINVKSLSAPGIKNISFSVAKGEVLGIAGLVGSGRTELVRAISGAEKRSSGTVTLHGRDLNLNSPKTALKNGICMIPESRKEQGLVLGRSIKENTTLSVLSALSRFGIVSRKDETAASAEILDQVTVKTTHLNLAVRSLSGGNQQKVLFARALLCNPKVFIADEPTRGVDVGSRRSIYDLIANQSRKGTATIVVSSDIEELLALAHRILVMRSGQIVAELSGKDMSEQSILKAAFSEVSK